VFPFLLCRSVKPSSLSYSIHAVRKPPGYNSCRKKEKVGKREHEGESRKRGALLVLNNLDVIPPAGLPARIVLRLERPSSITVVFLVDTY
jgi:hypothetical protein